MYITLGFERFDRYVCVQYIHMYIYICLLTMSRRDMSNVLCDGCCWVDIYIHMYLHSFYTHVCLCVCACLCACVCLCVCMCMYTYMSIRLCVYVYICYMRVNVCMNSPVCQESKRKL